MLKHDGLLGGKLALSFIERYDEGMIKILNWKRIGAVFVVAFVTSSLVAYLWERFFPGSSSRWDTTTTVAAIVIFVGIYSTRRCKKKVT